MKIGWALDTCIRHGHFLKSTWDMEPTYTRKKLVTRHREFLKVGAQALKCTNYRLDSGGGGGGGVRTGKLFSRRGLIR